MNGTHTSEQAIACLNLALERNKQLFNEAYILRCAALDFLDQPYLDAEMFTQYLEMKRYADLKYHDAIGHLQSIMTQSQVPPFSTETPGHVSAPTFVER